MFRHLIRHRDSLRGLRGLLGILDSIGSLAISRFELILDAFDEVGRAVRLFILSLKSLLMRPFRYKQIVQQLDFIGFQSITLVSITGTFTGMVLTLQGQIGLSRYGADSLLGAGVALALARELGPVLAALMVVGRAGSSMAAELGTMRNTQQIDALVSMGVDPVQFLVMPRIVAGTIALPLLAVMFEFFGMLGSYMTFTVHLLKDKGTFMASVPDFLTMDDVTHGLIKAAVFGTVTSLVCCSKGFYATGGSVGVGRATTRAVVISSLLVLASDYVMTAIMYHPSY